MNLKIADTYEEMSREAAKIVITQVTNKADSVLGLATGSTPLGLYEEIVKTNKKKEIDFSKVRTFNLDEYYPIHPEDPYSYAHYMDVHLFDYLNLSRKHIHLPDGATTNVEQECRDYEAKIKSVGGIDLQVLGIGTNGHIGFNEPNHYFEKRTHLVDLNQETIEANAHFFGCSSKVPSQAISMGIASIMEAKRILLLASGKQKAEVIEKALFGKISPQLPASILQLHKEVYLVLDQEAAASIINQVKPPSCYWGKVLTQQSY
ncbi:glucosamine-6-phosphate deaminase [Anoxynatronum sibiricum]|uniref:glucosamine-6-phosphate deaminase n=1 Tax=Anoxynatronum sibiricum TaxID=210623 RepID=UPI003CCD663C